MNKYGTPNRSKATVTKAVAAATKVLRTGSIAKARSSSAPLATRGFRPGFGQSGVKGEKKVTDLASATYAMDTTGSVTALNLCAQGTDYTNRVGRITKPVSVQVRGYTAAQALTGGNNSSLLRAMLVWDSQPNGGALPAITDILTAAVGTAFNNLSNRDRFKIIRDEKIPVGEIVNTATQAFSNYLPQKIDWWVPLGADYVTQYGGTGATIGDVQHGSLLLVTLGTSAAGVGHNLVANTRVRFTDN